VPREHSRLPYEPKDTVELGSHPLIFILLISSSFVYISYFKAIHFIVFW